MSRVRIYAASLVLVIGASAASSQAVHPIEVLEIPNGIRTQPSQNADNKVIIGPVGRINPSRQIWARVFNEPLDVLTHKQPIPPEKCVVYKQTAIYRVNQHDGVLDVGDLEDFFSWVHNPSQTMTLVFEEGGDRSSGGPLYLDRSAVQGYFAYAVPVPMRASVPMRHRWDAEATSERAASNPSTGFLQGLLGLPKVHAAASPPSPNPKPEPAVLKYDCQTVKHVSMASLAENNGEPSPNLEALAPVGLLVDENCKS